MNATIRLMNDVIKFDKALQYVTFQSSLPLNQTGLNFIERFVERTRNISQNMNVS